MFTLNVAVIVSAVVAIGLVFALTNGLHDASSVVATFISSGAASPRAAILLASCFGVLGAVFGGSAVANTVSGIIDLPAGTALLPVLLAAILGAVTWNLITWRLGLPSSSTHALVGGIIGAVVMAAGPGHVLWGFGALVGGGGLTGIAKVVLSLIISPFIGFVCAFLLKKISGLLLRNAHFSVNSWLRRIQWVFAAGLSFSHGANDTQKITGLLTLALTAGGAALNTAPLWVRLAGGTVMFLGTLLGGWSIMKTIGRGIFDIQPIHSVNSQLASVGAVLAATFFGAPVSTTHVVVGQRDGRRRRRRIPYGPLENGKGHPRILADHDPPVCRRCSRVLSAVGLATSHRIRRPYGKEKQAGAAVSTPVTIFYQMLHRQAAVSAQSIAAFADWLHSAAKDDSDKALSFVDQADTVRMDMEEKLIQSFSTPFDRTDIYSISVGMDKVVKYMRATLLSVQEYGIIPDKNIIAMITEMRQGAEVFAQAIGLLKSDPGQSGLRIPSLRQSHDQMGSYYRRGMSALFAGADAMHALKYREIYSLLRSASEKLEDAVDILHRIVVRLT